MSIRLLVGLGVLLCSMSAVAQNQSLDLNLNNDAVRLMYAGSLGDNGMGGLGLDAGFLRNRDKGNVSHVGINVTGDAGMRNLPTEVAVGGNLYWVDPRGSSEDGLAVALGLRFHSIFPQYNRLGVGGHAYYAPAVLSFADADRYSEWALRVNYHIIRQAHVYVGYRRIRVKFDDGGTGTADSGVHLGLKLNF